jgi:hypothetical protein
MARCEVMGISTCCSWTQFEIGKGLGEVRNIKAPNIGSVRSKGKVAFAVPRSEQLHQSRCETIREYQRTDVS